MNETDPFVRLLQACRTIMLLYDATVYGQQHREVKHLRLLEKLGSKPASSMARRDLQNAIEEVSAIESKDESDTIDLKFTAKELRFLRKAVRHDLRSIRRIPKLARKQAVIALSATFEGFVSDVISEVFDANPRALKSGKSTLKDRDLVEAIQEGNPLQLLKSHRLRDIMYGSVTDWLRYLNNSLGFAVAENSVLAEMFLVRNAIIHNNARVSVELSAVNLRFKSVGRGLNVTEKDLRRYTSAVRTTGEGIWEERQQRFPVA